MSEKPLVNAPNDTPPVSMNSDEPLPDPGSKTNYPVVAEDVIKDHVKTHYPTQGAE